MASREPIVAGYESVLSKAGLNVGLVDLSSLNLVLLVNLAVAGWLSALFLRRRSTLHRLERWQTAYLPVFAAWAAAVVVVLPPLFGFS